MKLIHRLSKYTKSPFLISLILTIVSILPLSLQSAEVPSIFRTVTSEEGLSNNIVHVIYKDTTGFIWLGTQAGLNRFDGNEIKRYKTFESEVVYTILEQDQKNLLIGTENGLFCLNRSTELTDTIRLESKNLAVRSLCQTNDKRIFAGTEGGLFLINGSQVEKIPFENGIAPSNKIRSIAKQNDTIYWFASQDGLACYDLKNKTSRVFRNSQIYSGGNNYTSLVICDSIIYVGSYNKGVFSFDIENKTFNHLNAFNFDYVMNMSYSRDKKLYVGTNGAGLKIYSPQTNKMDIISHSPDNLYSVSSNSIYSFLLDDNNTFWIGTFMKGFNYNPGKRDNFFIYKFGKYSTSTDNIRSAYITPAGDKLIGTRSGLVYISERKNIIQRISKDTPGSILRSDIILHLFPFRNKILVGTYGGGMYFFDPNTGTLSEPEMRELRQPGCFFRFATDKNNRLWMASDEGVFYYDPSTLELKKYTVANSSLLNNNVTYLTCDSRNRIWMSTLDGLCVFDQSTGTIRTDLFTKEIASTLKKFHYVMEDHDGNLWICKARGLLKVDISLNKVIPYFDDNVFVAAYENSPDDLWFATDKGVFRYNSKAGTGELFPVMDGLTDVDCSNVIQKTTDNLLWLSTGKGLFYCSPDNIKDLNNKGKPVITELLVNQKPLALSEKYQSAIEYLLGVSLPSSSNDIGFRFSLLTYTLPKSEFYEYKLEGYDKDWQPLIGKYEVSYVDLPSGNYMFRLRDPLNPSVEKEFKVKIRKSYRPFVLAAVAIFMIIWLIYLLRRKKKQETSLVTEPVVNEDADKKKKYHYASFSEKDADKLENSLLDYMQNGKPYIHSDLKLQDLADNLSCTTRELSQLFSGRMNTNFTDFVNKYRVEEFKMKIKESSSTKYTLASLSEKCGFNSRVTFYRAFKKVTGITPQDYARSKGVTLTPE